MHAVKTLPSVLQSAQYIASRSRHVTISEEAVKSTAEHLAEQSSFKTPEPRGEAVQFEPAGLSNVEILEWIFLIDTLNFCFWSDVGTEPFTVSYLGKKWTGSRSLSAALARAVKEGTPVYKPSFYGSITMDQLKHIFRSETATDIPLLKERLHILHETADILSKVFNNQVSQLFMNAERSAQQLVTLLGTNFPSYCDTSVYQGREVSFLKRAQLLASDVWTRFCGCGFGEFHDIHTLTMFADYRVPQSLQYLGLLEYSQELKSVVKQGHYIALGDEMEVEIRGCSIWAVELIRQHLAKQCHSSPSDEEMSGMSEEIKTVLIDHYLWKYASTHPDKMTPFPIHRTRTIFY